MATGGDGQYGPRSTLAFYGGFGVFGRHTWEGLTKVTDWKPLARSVDGEEHHGIAMLGSQGLLMLIPGSPPTESLATSLLEQVGQPLAVPEAWDLLVWTIPGPPPSPLCKGH